MVERGEFEPSRPYFAEPARVRYARLPIILLARRSVQQKAGPVRGRPSPGSQPEFAGDR
jgi:hypothetical protein